MRPKKTRWISCDPGERCFRPQCKDSKELQGIVLNLDEFEVMRLTYLEKLSQEEIASQMKIHRSTVSRILSSANIKVADALVNIKSIKIERGCCETSIIKEVNDEN